MRQWHLRDLYSCYFFQKGNVFETKIIAEHDGISLQSHSYEVEAGESRVLLHPQLHRKYEVQPGLHQTLDKTKGDRE